MKLVANRKVILCLLTVITGLALILGISRYILPKKPTPTITDEVHNETTSYLQKDVQDLSHLEDDILQMISLKADQIRQLNKVLPHDRKMAAKFDIPEKDLATTPSDVLCKHFFAVSPLRIWFGMYDDRNMGITRAIRGSSTLGTLFGREDIIPAIIKVYQETPLEPEKMQDLDPGTTSMSLMTIDEFLIYPPVFEKVAGYEKQILSVLCDRYRRMERVNSSRADDPLYGAIYSSTKHLILLLLERVRPSLHNSLVRERKYSKLVAQVEKMLSD